MKSSISLIIRDEMQRKERERERERERALRSAASRRVTPIEAPGDLSN